MTADPLHRPLGLAEKTTAVRRRPSLAWGGLTALGCVVAVAAIVWLVRAPDLPLPTDVAVARIEVAPKTPPVPEPAAPKAAEQATAAPPQASSDTVEIQHGVKVIRLGAATSATSKAIAVPDQSGDLALRPAPDPRLVETTRFGALPRIGAGGARPAEVYARPAPSGAAVVPRIALVASGMGMRQLETAEAARTWPPAVTFAFPPDVPDAATQVAEARSAGHEVILQLPGAFGQARSTTGETTGTPVLDLLRRAMGRFTGYAGVSYEGTTNASPDVVQDEIGKRGLYLIDPRPPAAGALGPSPSPRRADVIVTAQATAALLDRLVADARSSGMAVGWIADPGADGAVIASFANGLSRQKIALVPLSALADGAVRAPRASK